MATLRSLLIGLDVDASRSNRELRRSRRQFRDYSRDVSRSFRNISRVATGAAVAFAGFAAAGVKAASQLETTFAQVAAQTGNTFARISGDYGKLVNDLRVETGRGLDSIGPALTRILSAGVEGPDVETLLRQATQFETASLGRADLAASAATTVLSLYRDEIERTTDAMDLLARTAQSGEGSTAEFSTVFKQALPAAKALKVPLNEAAAALAAISLNAPTAVQGGTQFRSFMQSLEKPTANATRLIEKLSLSFEGLRSRVAAGDIAGVVRDLQRLESTDLARLITNIEGRAFVQSVNPDDIEKILANLVETYRGTVVKAVEEVEGTTAVLWDQIGQSWQVALSEGFGKGGGFEQELQGLLDSAGGLDGLNDLFEEIADSLGRLTAGLIKTIKSLYEWRDVILLAVGAWASFRAALLVQSVIGAFGALATAIGLATTAQKGLNTAMRLNPIGAVVTVIGLAVTAIILFKDEIQAVRDAALELLGLADRNKPAARLKDVEEQIGKLKGTISKIGDGESLFGKSKKDLQDMLSRLEKERDQLRIGLRPEVSSSGGAPFGSFGIPGLSAAQTTANRKAAEEERIATERMAKVVSDLGDAIPDVGRAFRALESPEFSIFRQPSQDLFGPGTAASFIANAPEKALEGEADPDRFRPYAEGVTNGIVGALQQSLFAGSFKDFGRNVVESILHSLSQEVFAVMQESLDQLFSTLFNSVFGSLGGGGSAPSVPASHSGEINYGSSNRELLRLITADESILKPDQMAAIYANGAASARGFGDVNISYNGVDYGADWRRQARQNARDVSGIVRTQQSEVAV